MDFELGYRKPVYRFLDTNGDGTGTKNATGNYAAAATDFFIAPSTGERLYLARLIVLIEDGAAWFDSGDYGAIAGGLTNGVVPKWVRNGTTHDLTDGVPVTNNVEWAQLCYDVSLQTFGAGNSFLTVRWTFERRGAGLVLASPQDKFSITLNDDLTELVKHRFQVQGYVID